MTQRHALFGFIATLVTLVAVLAITYAAIYFAPAIIGKVEAFGLGTVTGGLITLAASFRPRAQPEPQA